MAQEATRRVSRAASHCVIMSSVLLVASGVVTLVLALMHMNSISDALDRTCSGTELSLACHLVTNATGVNCGDATIKAANSALKCNAKNQCLRQLKLKLGCSCATDSASDCNCAVVSNTGISTTTTIGQIIEYWRMEMIVVGSVACGVGLFIAIAGFMASCAPEAGGGCCLYSYSFFSFLATWCYLLAGCAFVILGMIADAINRSQSKGVSVTGVPAVFGPTCKAELAKSFPGDTCSATRLCEAVEILSEKMHHLGLGVGYGSHPCVCNTLSIH